MRFKNGQMLRRKSDGLVFEVTSAVGVVALRVPGSMVFDHGSPSDIRERFEVVPADPTIVERDMR